MNDPQTIDPRRRIRELLSIPDRDRTDAEWDELNELEIRTAPGNRLSGNPDYHGQSDRVGHKRQGQPGQQGQIGNNKKRKDKPHAQQPGQQGQQGQQGQKTLPPRPQENRPEGAAGSNRPSKRQHRRHKQRQGNAGEGGGSDTSLEVGGAVAPANPGNSGGESAS